MGLAASLLKRTLEQEPHGQAFDWSNLLPASRLHQWGGYRRSASSLER
jgi:hypothetical protein